MKSFCLAASLPSSVVALSLLLAGCADRGPARDASGLVDIGDSVFYDRSVGMRRMPPLHERGVKTLAVLYEPWDKVTLQYIGITVFENEVHEVDTELVVPKSYVDDLFVSAIQASPQIEGRVLGPAEARLANHIKPHWFTGERIIGEEAKRILADLRSRDIDAVLVVQEPETLSNFFDSTQYETPPKIIYDRLGWDIYAIAAFQFFLLDTATGEEMKNSSYTQASMAKLVGVNELEPFETYGPSERQAITQAVRARLENNVKLTLQLLKIIPGDEGQFLTYDEKKEKYSFY